MQQPTNHFSITLNNPSTSKASPPNMIALKKIQNYSYALTDEIGLGFTSHVYRGKNQLNNEQVAVKVIDLKNNEDELHNHFMNQEVIVLEKIKDARPQNLLKLECVIKTKNNMYIITEFCEGKDLGKILRKRRRIPENQAHSIMKQVLKGFKQLYQLQLIHRDLKLANLFITQGKVKIADFGFTISESKSHEKMEYNVGSPYYMPPQALKYNRYSYKSDIWGLGVIAFQLVYGRVPWRDKNDEILFQMMTNTPVENLFDADVNVTEEYKKFIKDCLTIDINRRITPQQILKTQWPMAQDYVNGMADENQRHQSIPLRNINKTQVYFNEQRPQNASKQKKTMQLIPRNRTPSVKKQQNKNHSFRQSNPIPLKPQEKTIDDDSSQQIGSNIPENAILGQLHYCRFMLALYKKLQNILTIPLISELRSELATKIIEKMKILGEMVRTQKNILKSPGFGKYVKKHQWQNLKQIIIKYDIKFREEFQHDELKTQNNEDSLITVIRQMKIRLPENWRILELLTFYHQLKEIEAKENSHKFYEHSKIEILAGDCRRSVEQFDNAEDNSQRLRKKLDFMLL